MTRTLIGTLCLRKDSGTCASSLHHAIHSGSEAWLWDSHWLWVPGWGVPALVTAARPLRPWLFRPHCLLLTPFVADGLGYRLCFLELLVVRPCHEMHPSIRPVSSFCMSGPQAPLLSINHDHCVRGLPSGRKI